MNKRIISIIITAVMLLGACPVYGHVTDEAPDTVYYTEDYSSSNKNVISGIGGKTADDISYYLNLTDGSNPRYDYTAMLAPEEHNDKTDDVMPEGYVMTGEYSIFIPNEVSGMSIGWYFGNASGKHNGGWHSLPKVDIPEAQRNRWHRVAYQVKTTKDKHYMDIYVDGVLKKQYNYTSGQYRYMYFAGVTIYGAGNAEKLYNDTKITYDYIIDDFVGYTGAYTPETLIYDCYDADTVSYADGVFALQSITTAGELAELISTEHDVRIYQDDTYDVLLSEDDKLTEQSKVVITNGRIFEYMGIDVQYVLPKAEITNLSDGAEYYPQDLPAKLTFTASDEDGNAEALDKAEVYIDGDLAAEFTDMSVTEFAFDMPALSYGRHTVSVIASTANGLTDEYSVEIFVAIPPNAPVLLGGEDFSKYETGTPPATTAMKWLNTDAGDFSVDTSRADTHGNAVNIRFIKGSRSNPYCVTTATISAYNTLQYDFDLKINSAKGLTYMLRADVLNTSHKGRALLQFGDSVLTYWEKGAKTSHTYEYPKGVWMRASLTIDFMSGMYTFVLTDEDGTELSRGEYASGLTTEYAEVCHYYTVDTDGSFDISYDDMEFYSIDSMPAIESVGANGDTDSPVTPDSATIDVRLTAAISSESVNKENIALMMGDEEVLLDSVTYKRGVITLTPGEQLISDEKYTFIIKPTAQMPAGEALGEALSVDFITTVRDYDLKTSRLITQGDTCKVSGEVQMTASAKSKKLYMVLSVYSGDKLTDITVTELDVTPSQRTFTTNTVKLPKGAYAELSILESLSAPLSPATKIYRY